MSTAPRRVLGIDPGTAILGYGVVTDENGRLELLTAGVVTTSPDLPLHRRLQTLYHGVRELLARYQPTEVAVEALFFNQNARSALAVGQARGVVLLAAAEVDLPVFEYTPLAVKHAVLNYGRGTKDQVQEMVRLLLKLPIAPEPDDAADAAAVAICHHHHAAAARVYGELPEAGSASAPNGSARRRRKADSS